MSKRCCLQGGWILLLGLMAEMACGQPTITNVQVGTAFRYQGAIRGVFPIWLAQNGTLQFQFGLWNDPADTNVNAQVGTNLFQTLNISNGFFSTMLDFGGAFDGRRRFLEVSVFAPSNTFPASSNWITVAPRTEIGTVPYALWALNGGTEVLKSEGTSFYGWSTYGKGGIVDDFFTGTSPVPGGFLKVGYDHAPTNIANFELLTAPKVIHEARLLVGGWYKEPGSTKNCAATLEVWRLTNIVDSIQLIFVRTLSAPTNLVPGTVPVGKWLSLPLTNSVRNLVPGEMLRLVGRSGFVGLAAEGITLRAEVVVRDAPP